MGLLVYFAKLLINKYSSRNIDNKAPLNLRIYFLLFRQTSGTFQDFLRSSQSIPGLPRVP